MKLLLDTHTFLWLVDGSPHLSRTATAALADPSNDLFLSVASIWELAIKTANPKQQLILSDPLELYVARWSAVYDLAELPIRKSHALRLTALPDHHRDPFDRILIAQAFAEGMTLVSVDGKFAPYAVSQLW